MLLQYISTQKNENRGPTYFYDPSTVPFDPYGDFPPPPAVGRGAPRNLPPSFSPSPRGGSWGRGGRGGRGGGRGGKQGGNSKSRQLNKDSFNNVVEGGYSGGGGGQPHMMGNNQQFNSPAAPPHSQPPFKLEHHPPPAPLVPGPSPVQPGNQVSCNMC